MPFIIFLNTIKNFKSREMMDYMVRFSNTTSFLHFWNVPFWIMEYLSFSVLLEYLLFMIFSSLVISKV